MVERLHDVAVRSIRYYSDEFGAYPYREYDVVKTGGFFGGMEYPSIVFIQGEFFNNRPDMGAAVVAHETAHQWFYGLVGSDEIREAWVDESLTDYATMAFLQQYDRSLARGYIDRRMERGRAAEQYARRGIGAWQSLDGFPDWKSYSDLVYSRGAAMLWELREAWGEKRVHQALRQYFQENQYGIATGNDVIEAFSQVAGADAAPYFDYWLRLDLKKEKQARQWLQKGKGGLFLFR
jgi:aminopeptidase N